MQPVKEKFGDVTASAKAGMEKTKATLQEKGEKMTTSDPLKKGLATNKKEQRIDEAELRKRAEYEQNAAEKHANQATTGHQTTTGTTGHHTIGNTGTTGLGGARGGGFGTDSAT